ncbi:MAG: hypothetical protein RLZZ528_1309 [Pseudomonadota bacterium]
MARFIAYEGINYQNLNLGWYWDHLYDEEFLDNANRTFLGITYEDIHNIFADDGTNDLGLFIGGSSLVVATDPGTGNLVGTSGSVTSLAEYFNAGADLWVVDGATIDIDELYAAIATSANTDDLALFDSVFSGDDTITLSDQNDNFLAGDGNDTLDGGNGNDTLDGGDGFDQLVFSGSKAAIVDLRTTTKQDTGYGQDKLISIEGLVGGTGNDKFTGDDNANEFLGNAGNDKLKGGLGADIFHSDAGTDILSAGKDSDVDTFLFTDTTHSVKGVNRDTVKQFVSGTDVLDLSGIDADTVTGGDQNFLWGDKTATAFGLWYKTVQGDIIVKADVNGDAKADFEVLLSKLGAIGSGDFVL